MNRMRTLTMAMLWVAGTLDRAWAAGVVLPLPPEDQQELTAQLGAGVVGQALPSTPITDTSIYFPLQERVLTYQVTAGSNSGKQQSLKVAKRSRPNGQAAWRFGLSPTLGAFLQQSAGGDLLMTTTTP